MKPLFREPECDGLVLFLMTICKPRKVLGSHGVGLTNPLSTVTPRMVLFTLTVIVRALFGDRAFYLFYSPCLSRTRSQGYRKHSLLPLLQFSLHLPPSGCASLAMFDCSTFFKKKLPGVLVNNKHKTGTDPEIFHFKN